MATVRGSSLSEMGKLSRILNRGVRRPVAAAWTTGSTGEITEEAAGVISVDPGHSSGGQEE